MLQKGRIYKLLKENCLFHYELLCSGKQPCIDLHFSNYIIIMTSYLCNFVSVHRDAVWEIVSNVGVNHLRCADGENFG